MKPDWKDAPEWAKWLAMDDGGEWTWFEVEPEVEEALRFWAEKPGTMFASAGYCSVWKHTKEEKPE